MARINNVGVFAELVGVVLLIILLLARARRGPAILFQIQTPGRAGSGSAGWLSALFAAAVMPSYVIYGFDTAGTLAEETSDPRRRAPWAILRALSAAGLAGGLLIIAGLLAVSDPAMPELGEITGGLPLIVKRVARSGLGSVFLAVVIFAVSVCALAVHAGTVRLIFAMARDNSLPFARILARVQHETRTPIVPAVVTGVAAAMILLVNVNLPQDHRDPLLRGHRLGQPGVPDGDPPAPAREAAGLAARAGGRGPRTRRGERRATVRAGPVGSRPEHCLGLLGALGDRQHELAPGRDLRRRPMGPVRGGAGHDRAGRARSDLVPGRAAERDRDPGRARGEHRAGDGLRPAHHPVAAGSRGLIRGCPGGD